MNGTKSRVRVGRQFSDTFEIHNGLKQRDALSPLLFNFVLEHAIKSSEEKEDLQLNGINKPLDYADDVVLLGGNEEILRANTHTLLSNTKKGWKLTSIKLNIWSQIDIHYIMEMDS